MAPNPSRAIFGIFDPSIEKKQEAPIVRAA
jgi:hypothetical protein